jgi:DNA-binding transcriptional LysR family regulator
MEWNQLRYFYEVARQASFTKASQTLRISQPSLSKMVNQLEKAEGYQFLERSKTGVRLTPMGKVLFEGCERLFSDFDSIHRSLHQLKEECSGTLSLGTSDNVGNYLFPEILASFKKLYPQVKMKVFSGTSGEIKKQLKEYQVELGFFYTPVREKELETQILKNIEFVIVSARELKFHELKSRDYIGSRVSDYAKPFIAIKLLRSIGLNPEIKIESNSLETQKRLAMSGLGFAVMPRHMVSEELKRGMLNVKS